jgi:hypothetical protein
MKQQVAQILLVDEIYLPVLKFRSSALMKESWHVLHHRAQLKLITAAPFDYLQRQQQHTHNRDTRSCAMFRSGSNTWYTSVHHHQALVHYWR